MDWKRVYDELISKSKSKNRKRGDGNYYERHHIIPSCLGGKGNLSSIKSHPNLVYLTAREHYIAHKLLHLIYPNNNKLLYALWMMMTMSDNTGRDYKISSKEYERVKEEYIKKNMYGKNNPIHRIENPMNNPESRKKISEANKGRKVSNETKEKIRKKALGRKLSDETKKKISDNLSGKKKPKEVVEKVAKANRGKKRTTEQIKAMSEIRKGVPAPHTSETNKRMNSMVFHCSHCGRDIGGRANFVRFHNDNCKKKASGSGIKRIFVN